MSQFVAWSLKSEILTSAAFITSLLSFHFLTFGWLLQTLGWPHFSDRSHHDSRRNKQAQ